jgi:hypothetical protein
MAPFKYAFRGPAASDEHTVDYVLSAFSGPQMPAETVVIKSLPGIPLRWEILQKDPSVHCFHSKNKKNEITSIDLEPNSSGVYEYVYCSKEHDKSEYPRASAIKMKVTLDLDQLTLPSDIYKHKTKLNEYLTNLNEFAEWTPDMEAYLQSMGQDNNIVLDPSSSSLQEITAPGDTSFDFKGISDGKYEFKAFLDWKEMNVEGEETTPKKAKSLIYPEYKEKALVCGIGQIDGKISKVLSVGNSLFSISRAVEGVYCQFNHPQGKNASKTRGDVVLTIRKSTWSFLKDQLYNDISQEEAFTKSKISNLFRNEISALNGQIIEYTRTFNSTNSNLINIVNATDLQKFNALRDKTINKLFPTPNSGTVSRAATLYTFKPVKKVFYNESGAQKQRLYLNLSNSIKYKFEGPLFMDEYDRDLPFEEKMNLYLVTKEDFVAQSTSTLLVCNDNVEKFQAKLVALQEESSGELMTYDNFVEQLRGYAVTSISSCKMTKDDASNLDYSRSGNFTISWAKSDTDGKKDFMIGKGVGGEYKTNFLGTERNFILEHKAPVDHPLFGKGYVKAINANAWNGSLDRPSGLYIRRYDQNKFISAED